MLGVPPGKVTLTAYQEDWPGSFVAERERLVSTLGDRVVAIEHIGSTAVTGMVAKPLIDLMIGVRSIEMHEACIEPMRELRYEYMGEYGIPDRHFFVLGNPTTHHAHLVEHDGEFWRLNLLFRDHLRSNRDARERYEGVKRELVARFADDRKQYTAGKDAIIRELLREAGWS